MLRSEVDIVGEKCIRSDEGKLNFTMVDKYHDKLVNEKFLWSAEKVSDELLIAESVIQITSEMVSIAISEMTAGGKAAGS